MTCLNFYPQNDYNKGIAWCIGPWLGPQCSVHNVLIKEINQDCVLIYCGDSVICCSVTSSKPPMSNGFGNPSQSWNSCGLWLSIILKFYWEVFYHYIVPPIIIDSLNHWNETVYLFSLCCSFYNFRKLMIDVGVHNLTLRWVNYILSFLTDSAIRENTTNQIHNQY